MRIFGWFRRSVREPFHGMGAMHMAICPSVVDSRGSRCCCACVKCFNPGKARSDRDRAKGIGCVCIACTHHEHHKEGS